MAPTVLLADIGGSLTRIACAGADGVPFDIRIETNDAHASLEDLIGAYLAGLSREPPCAAVLAVAGPVDGEEIRLTNRDWRFSRGEMAAGLRVFRLEVLNDFVAFAHALPDLGTGDLMPVGAGRAEDDHPRLVCGPGTGFGTAVVLPRDGDIAVLASEAGHMRFGAATSDEALIMAHMVREVGPLAVEHMLSGPGLARIHRIRTGAGLSTHAIVRAALDGQPGEKESCNVFLRILGRVVGDLTLAVEARGGVYIGGGVGRALAPLFAGSAFRAAFEDHPPFTDRLAQVPVQVVTHIAPGLVGAGRIGRRLLARRP